MFFKRSSDVFTVAAWAALGFGLLEGAVLALSRGDPLIGAAHKVSPQILWVSPAVDLLLFLAAALLLWPVVAVAERKLRLATMAAVFGLFVFLGTYGVLSAPRKLHPLSVVVLSLGVAVLLHRRFAKSLPRLAPLLRRWVAVIPAVLVVVAGGVWAAGSAQEWLAARRLAPAPADAPNVIVVVLDTVRGDRFGDQADHSLTPNLDRLAAQGTRFESAFSTSSWSLPAQASILTGENVNRHGADWPGIRLRSNQPSLPEFFATRGYATGAFSGNAAWITPEYVGRGFLRFDVYQLEDLARRTVHGRKLDKLLESVGYHSSGRGKKAPTINAQLLDFLDDYRGRRFFAYVCYMDVNQGFHARRYNAGDFPHAPIREVVRAADRALQDLDRQLGELFAELERRGALKNTMVVITSDHGESFGVEYADDHDPDGHGTSLYREQTAVPLFVIYPGHVGPGRRELAPVSIRQIPATITALLQVEGSPFPGPSLLVAPADGAHSRLYAEIRDLNNHLLARSLTESRWKYLVHPEDRGGLRKGEELYDLAADAAEKNNLAASPSNEAMLGRMRQDVGEFAAAAAVSSQQGRTHLRARRE